MTVKIKWIGEKILLKERDGPVGLYTIVEKDQIGLAVEKRGKIELYPWCAIAWVRKVKA